MKKGLPNTVAKEHKETSDEEDIVVEWEKEGWRKIPLFSLLTFNSSASSFIQSMIEKDIVTLLDTEYDNNDLINKMSKEWILIEIFFNFLNQIN